MPVARLLAVSVLFLFVLLTAAPASSQILNGPYDGKVYVAGGAQWLFDQEFDITNPLSGNPTNPGWDFDNATGGFLALGYHFAGFRIEGEVSTWSTDATFLTDVNIQGDIDNLAFMGNAYYDIPVVGDMLDVYLGVGAGATLSDFNFDNLDITAPGGGATIASSTGDDIWIATFQLMAGVTLHVQEHLALTAGYRIRFLDESNFNDIVLDEDAIHSLELGLRIRF